VSRKISPLSFIPLFFKLEFPGHFVLFFRWFFFFFNPTVTRTFPVNFGDRIFPLLLPPPGQLLFLFFIQGPKQTVVSYFFPFFFFPPSYYYSLRGGLSFVIPLHNRLGDGERLSFCPSPPSKNERIPSWTLLRKKATCPFSLLPFQIKS